MKKINKVVVVNLLILLTYSLIIRALVGTGSGNLGGLGIMITSAYVICAHVFLNTVIAAFFYGSSNNEMGKAFMLSAGIVLVVGFGTCLGNASI